MKLDETNARFAVVRTAFHNGGTISFHNSLEAAKTAKKQNTSATCECGCCGVVPVTPEARTELMDDANRSWYHIPVLYSELEYWDVGKQGPYTLCK